MEKNRPLEAKSRPTKPMLVEVAVKFLKEKYVIDSKYFTLRYIRNQFFVYDGSRYLPLGDDALFDQIVSFLQADTKLKKYSKSSFVKDVLTNVRPLVRLSDNTNLPAHLGKLVTNTQFVSMANGIVELNPDTGKVIAFLDPTPELITLSSMHYNYDPLANCPIFIRTIGQILPDESVRRFIQEWFGYNLVYDHSFVTFVMLYGLGRNGKSVITGALRQLLGKGSVSSVGLEAFSKERRYDLYSTIGKLANICDDMDRVPRLSEGLLKSYVMGEYISVEEKFKPRKEERPTARLTYSTNEKPQFYDRSDGVWRRVVMVPFNQIIDDDEDDPRLVHPNFWLERNELSGMFNWALSGLQRLRERGRFDVPEACRDLKEGHRRDCNPIRSYLLDHFTFDPTSPGLFTGFVHEKYIAHANVERESEVPKRTVTNEIKVVFPGVRIAKSPVATRGQVKAAKDRLAIGLALRLDEKEVKNSGV